MLILFSYAYQICITIFFIVDEGMHQLELNPLMLTILGIVAGVLIVIVLVLAAIRVHASRNRRRRGRGGGNSGVHGSGSVGGPGSDAGSGNKVVVTTIEELDLDHNVNSDRNLMLLDSLQVGGGARNLNSSAKLSTSGNNERSPFIQSLVPGNENGGRYFT